MSPPDLSSFGLAPLGTVSPTSGTFSPTGPTEGGRLNPFIDPSPWGKVEVGGFELPFVLSVDGAERPEEWSFQKGTASSGATSVWKGTKLAEAIKILVGATKIAHFEGLYTLRDTLRPKLGSKPPSLTIVSPVINFNGITRVASALIGQPKHVKPGNYWTLEITLCEYNPSKPTNAGPAGAAKTKGAPDPNADLKAQVQKALDKAAKLGGA